MNCNQLLKNKSRQDRLKALWERVEAERAARSMKLRMLRDGAAVYPHSCSSRR